MSAKEKNPEKEIKETKVEKKIWHPQQEKILKEWAKSLQVIDTYTIDHLLNLLLKTCGVPYLLYY